MVTLPGEKEIIAGKYRVEGIIGQGGMGVVMAAWHLELDQRVALKFLMPELVERGEAAERFRREARAAARIKSEHVVRVIDVGNWEGNAPYMVMEYLDGRDLSAELQERGTLPIKECVDYLLQAIEAVAEAHALGIVHRDLKPENLFLAKRVDGSRSIKVLDFGISKTIVLGSSDERSLTRTANIMGSPFYMSPEQMRAPRNVDTRSDIWALGAILYDVLTGQPPYVAETIPQLCTMMLESNPAPLRLLRPEASSELEQVVARCLAKDLTDRWSTVVDLARALLPFASRASRIHVERAARVLGGSGSGVPPPESSLRSEPPSPLPIDRRSEAAGATRRRETPTQASEAPSIAVPETGTEKSWGSTHQPRVVADQGAAESSRPAWQKLAVAVAALIVVAGIVAALRSASSPRSETGSSASVLAPTEISTAPVASAVSVGPVREAPASEAAAGHESTPASSAPSKTPAPTIAGSAASAESAAKKPPVRPLLPRVKPSASSGLTDFGGRR
jgi:eukaryotic-like serine/threonine-protein kinase